MFFHFHISGIEGEYEQRLMPDGRFAVDGFVLVYDVSMVPNRFPEKQTDFCAQILSNIMKCRPPKPCVIAATKCDEANEILVRELERLVNRKGMHLSMLPLQYFPILSISRFLPSPYVQ